MEAGSKIFQIYGVPWKAKNLCVAAVSPHAAIQWEPRRWGPTDSSIYALVVLTIFPAVPKIDRHRNHKPSRISVSKFKSGILSHFPCVVHNSNSCLGCMGSIKMTQFPSRWLNPPFLTIGWCLTGLTGLTIHSFIRLHSKLPILPTSRRGTIPYDPRTQSAALGTRQLLQEVLAWDGQQGKEICCDPGLPACQYWC